MEKQVIRGRSDTQKKDSLIKVFNSLVTRMSLAARLGAQYGTSRDLYEALGYKTELKYEDYATVYIRQDIAKAVIDRPADVTWQGKLELQESTKKEDTEFEKAWAILEETLMLKDKFCRVDKLVGIGTYAVILLGLDDVAKREDFIKPVSGAKKKLKYIKVYGEGNAEIEKSEDKTNSERYGEPLLYKLKTYDVNSKTTNDILVHHSRVVHIVDDILESDIQGSSRLESIYNRLMDLEKIVGGDAEMFWRGARPGYAGVADKEFTISDEAKEDFMDQIDEYEHNLRRILISEGIDLKTLTQQIADPMNHVDIQIQMISAVTGIPKRILMGSERGELSSQQDSGEWKTFVKGRRERHAEKHIIRPFVNKCLQYGILPKPSSGRYSVNWDDLFSMSEKEKADVGRTRATAIREYTANPNAEYIIPPEAFMEFCLGLNTEQRQVIENMITEPMREERRNLEEQEEIEEGDNE
jgi:hypothetical protein